MLNELKIKTEAEAFFCTLEGNNEEKLEKP